MKTLLIIAYYFAPAAVVGTHRVVRFVKYLAQQNWQSMVVTVDTKFYDLNDRSLTRKIDNSCAVYRTHMITAGTMKRMYESTSHGGVIEVGAKIPNRNRLTTLARQALTFPDTRIGWFPYAVRQSLSIIRGHPIDAIFTTSYPYTAHLIGLLLKILTRKPWLVDFRDPWAEYAFLSPDTKWARKISFALEQRVIKSADVVIANTPAARDRLHERYKGYASKIISITNGFDADDFAHDQCHDQMPEVFTFTHSGSIFPGEDRRSPEPFLRGLHLFIQKHPDLKQCVNVRFVGHTHYSVNLREMAARHDVEPNVTAVGYLSHDDCIRELVSANALLLIHHSGKAIDHLYSTVPAKFYEYLGARKPILCLSSAGYVNDLISQLQTGLSIDPTDCESICQGIEDIFFNYRHWVVRLAENALIERYEAKTLTEELASTLDAIIDTKDHPINSRRDHVSSRPVCR